MKAKNPAISGAESKATPALSADRVVASWTLSESAMRGYCQITPRLKSEQEVVRKSDYDALKAERDALQEAIKGHAWSDFLHHRSRMLTVLETEGKTPEYMAQMMNMDVGQVRLILARQKEPRDPDNFGQCSTCRADQIGEYHRHPCE